MKMNCEYFNNNIKIRKCTSSDVDSIYNIQNIVIDNFKEEEKGYFLPFKKETYLRIVNDPIIALFSASFFNSNTLSVCIQHF